MLKNITFNVDEKIIDRAREKALRNKTTLNELIKQWLSGYAMGGRRPDELDEFLESTGYAASGRSFTRDELNER